MEPDKSEPAVKPLVRKVVLTSEVVVLPASRLAVTPSSKDGLDAESEMELRILGCELIQTAGILLKLPQTAMATGQVLLQRFYYSKSFVRHPMERLAIACVCLASKIEETPRRARDVINTFHHIKQMNNEKTITPLILDANYTNLKNQVIKAERQLLKELGFCVHVKHPHKIIVMYLKQLQLDKNTELSQKAWNYMNDSLRTDVFVRYSPEVISSACIYLAARKVKLVLPRKPSWFKLFSATEEEIQDIAIKILNLYKRPKPNLENLEGTVQKLKKSYEDAKVKVKPTKKPSRGRTSRDPTPDNKEVVSRSRSQSPVLSSANQSDKSPERRRQWSPDRGDSSRSANKKYRRDKDERRRDRDKDHRAEPKKRRSTSPHSSSSEGSDRWRGKSRRKMHPKKGSKERGRSRSLSRERDATARKSKYEKFDKLGMRMNIN